MSAISELREVLEEMQTASFVTTMLRDISATRLQQIRAAFDANHAYFLELHELMKLVEAYNEEFLELAYAHKEPLRAYVAITSNKRFYGTLNHQVIHALTEAHDASRQAECFVIGATGKQILEASELQLPASFIQYESDNPSSHEMFGTMQALARFDEIMVIHPTFVNSFTQRPSTTDLTHAPKKEELKDHMKIDYLFEPDIPKMLAFFKTQIRLVLYSRVMLETQLALTGARLMKMQRAKERSEELLKEERRVIHKEISTVQSMRLLEAFAGFRKQE